MLKRRFSRSIGGSASIEKFLGFRLALSTLQQMSHDRKLLRTEVERFPVLLKEAIKRAAKQVSFYARCLMQFVRFKFVSLKIVSQGVDATWTHFPRIVAVRRKYS